MTDSLKGKSLFNTQLLRMIRLRRILIIILGNI